MTSSILDRFLFPSLMLFAMAASHAAIDVVPPGGGGGTDGVLDPSVDDAICVGGLTGGICEIDLALAACDCSGSPPSARTVCPAEGSPDRCTWNGTNPSDDDPSGTVGNGVYDGDKWAVVYRFNSVNIQSGVTVRFTNHPKRAPVVWLVDGSVTIAGSVEARGSDHTGLSSTLAEPGPGGFRGGRSRMISAAESPGFGPGGGQSSASGGSYGSLGQNFGGVGPTYGNDRVLPLIGGSGGAGDGAPAEGGSGGGGAILIAADDTVTLGGSINANSGQAPSGGGGAGGGIRIVADRVTGLGTLRAQGDTAEFRGGDGRIRVEANEVTLTDIGAPPYTSDFPCAGAGCTPDLWPEDVSAPEVRITSIDGESAPMDPLSSFNFHEVDVRFADPNPVTVVIEAENLAPQPTDWTVRLRITPRSADYIESDAVLQGGDATLSTWNVDVAFPNGFAAVQVRAFK